MILTAAASPHETALEIQFWSIGVASPRRRRGLETLSYTDFLYLFLKIFIFLRLAFAHCTLRSSIVADLVLIGFVALAGVAEGFARYQVLLLMPTSELLDLMIAHVAAQICQKLWWCGGVQCVVVLLVSPG